MNYKVNFLSLVIGGLFLHLSGRRFQDNDDYSELKKDKYDKGCEVPDNQIYFKITHYI